MHDDTIFSRLLGALKEATGVGTSRAGNKSSGNKWASQILTTVAPIAVYDVVPSEGDKRVVKLTTDAALGIGTTLVFGYNPGNVNEGTSVPIAPASDTVREFVAVIEFGNGNARFTVEIDITEGTRLSVFGNDIEVVILDYSLQIPTFPFTYWSLENMGSAAYLPGHQGVRTQRCYFPLVVPQAVDLPEIIEDLSDALAGILAPPALAPAATSALPFEFPESAPPASISISGTNFVIGDTEFVFTGPGPTFTLPGAVSTPELATVVGTAGIWIEGGYFIRAQLISNPATGTDSVGPLIQVLGA